MITYASDFLFGVSCDYIIYSYIFSVYYTDVVYSSCDRWNKRHLYILYMHQGKYVITVYIYNIAI